MNSDSVANSYRELILQVGETVTINRAPSTTAAVLAVVRMPRPEDLVGAVVQYNRVAIVLATDIISASWPLPFRPKQDQLVWNGKTLTVVAVEDRRITGVTIAYELKLTGA